MKDDVISRQAAIEHYRVTDPEGTFTYCSSVIDFLEGLPSAQPERKVGRWIIYVVSPFDGEDCKCSVCGAKGCAPYWDYCPHCGAKMEERNE